MANLITPKLVLQVAEAASDYEITHAEAMAITAGMFSDLTSAMMFGFMLWTIGMLGMTVSKGFLPEHHSSGEEAEEGLKWITKEEARTALHNHPCITWFLVAMAGAEALEHNAAVSSALTDISPKLKGMLSEEDWDEVVYELDWFEHPITEMTANIAVSGSLSKLEEECNVDTTKARRLLVEGVDAIEAGRTAISRQKFIDLKMELLSLAEKREKE